MSNINRRMMLSGLASAPFILRSNFSHAADKPFVIGAVLPKTGLASQYGDFVSAGLTVGISQVNAAGGILGRQVQLLVRDDATNPGRALLAAKELVSEQRVDFLYPGVISGTTMAVLPFTTANKIVTLSNGASPQIGDAAKFPYSFQLADLATKRIAPMAAAMKRLGGTKVGILVSTNPPQVALGDGLAAELPQTYGLPVVGYKQHSGDAKDLTPQLQSLREAGADIIAFSTVAREGVRVVMLGLQTLGWKAKVVGEPAALYGDLTEQVPSAVHDQFFAVNYRIGTQLKTSSPARDQLIGELRKVGPIQNLAISSVARDVVHLFAWTCKTSQAKTGGIGAEALKATLESIGTSDLPSDVSLVMGNPNFSRETHTTGNADYRNLWGLVRVSKPVDGAYEGEALPL
ncbi:MAG: ABC transporter substrate-binding protein [Xanthobacteraceae bacterium]